jgi:hypothetical protein
MAPSFVFIHGFLFLLVLIQFLLLQQFPQTNIQPGIVRGVTLVHFAGEGFFFL